MWEGDHCTVNSWGPLREPLAAASDSTPQRNLCSRQYWSGRCLFRESLRVSHNLFSRELLFFLFSPLPPPPPLQWGPIFLLCWSSQWPLLWGKRQTLSPAKGLSASVVSFGLGQKRTDAAHTQYQAPPTPHPHNRLPHSPPRLPFPISPICFLSLSLSMTRRSLSDPTHSYTAYLNDRLNQKALLTLAISNVVLSVFRVRFNSWD